MVKSEDGVVELKGTKTDVLSDIGCVIAATTKALHKAGYTKEQIRDTFADIVSQSYSYAMRDIANGKE